MRNRFIYIFIKDPSLIFKVAFTIILAVAAVLALRLENRQASDLKALQEKKQLIAQIPRFEAQLQKIADNEGLLLNGIIYNEDFPLVIINNVVMKIGGEVNGKVVQSISRNSVVLSDKMVPEKTIELLLEE